MIERDAIRLSIVAASIASQAQHHIISGLGPIEIPDMVRFIAGAEALADIYEEARAGGGAPWVR